MRGGGRGRTSEQSADVRSGAGGAPPSGQDREAGAPQPLQPRSGAFSKSLTPTGSASPAGQWGREGEWICSGLSPPLHTVRDSKIQKDGAGPRALGFT